MVPLKKKSQNELREEVTTRITQAMEKGTAPWREGYRCDPNSGFPTNVISQEKYKGINRLLLMSTSIDKDYKSKWWGTYAQWHGMAAQVRKGEHGTLIVFYRPVTKEEEEDPKKRHFFVLRCFTIFNVDQVNGDHLSMFRATPDSELEDRFMAMQSYEKVDNMLEAVGAKVEIGDEPKYLPATDKIIMPKKSLFVDLRSYYATKFRQYVSWTHSRLSWPPKHSGLQGADLGAMSNLVSEIGACYLETEMEIPHCEDMTNHAAYLTTWLRVLRGNHRRIFEASNQAMKAVDYLLEFSKG